MDDSDQPRKKPRLAGPEEHYAEAASALDSPLEPADGQKLSATELVRAQLEQERRVGITTFAADEVQFSCIVKQRCVHNSQEVATVH